VGEGEGVAVEGEEEAVTLVLFEIKTIM